MAVTALGSSLISGLLYFILITSFPSELFSAKNSWIVESAGIRWIK